MLAVFKLAGRLEVSAVSSLEQSNQTAACHQQAAASSRYFDATTAGGCQLPLPAGRIEGAVVFGQ